MSELRTRQLNRLALEMKPLPSRRSPPRTPEEQAAIDRWLLRNTVTVCGPSSGEPGENKLSQAFINARRRGAQKGCAR